jgi:hypothetical protein
MGISALFASSLFVVLRDEGLTAVWETLLAFQLIRAIGFGYRFWEPLGPLSLAKPRKRTVLIGEVFSVDASTRPKALGKRKPGRALKRIKKQAAAKDREVPRPP